MTLSTYINHATEIVKRAKSFASDPQTLDHIRYELLGAYDLFESIARPDEAKEADQFTNTVLGYIDSLPSLPVKWYYFQIFAGLPVSVEARTEEEARLKVYKRFDEADAYLVEE